TVRPLANGQPSRCAFRQQTSDRIQVTPPDSGDNSTVSSAENKTASRWAKGYARDPPLTPRRGLARSLFRPAFLSRHTVLTAPLQARLRSPIREAADGLPVRAPH